MKSNCSISKPPKLDCGGHNLRPPISSVIFNPENGLVYDTQTGGVIGHGNFATDGFLSVDLFTKDNPKPKGLDLNAKFMDNPLLNE